MFLKAGWRSKAIKIIRQETNCSKREAMVFAESHEMDCWPRYDLALLARGKASIPLKPVHEPAKSTRKTQPSGSGSFPFWLLLFTPFYIVGGVIIGLVKDKY